MKKMLNIILLALLGAGVVVIQSCRKENVNSFGREKMLVDSKLIHGTDAEIEQRIKVFKQQCAFLAANPEMKNSSMLYYDDAFWLMEASLNYTYGFPGESAAESRIDSCIITISKPSGDSVELQSIAQAYQVLMDSIEYFYGQVIWEDKRILIADLALQASNDPGEYKVKLSILTGVDQDEPIPFGNPYNESDYWFYGGLAGKCGPYYPCCFGYDAVTEISKYQEWFKPVVPLLPGEHLFYTDIEPIIIFGNTFLNPDDPTPNDNQLDYLMFYSDPALPNAHDCLDPTQMWFYLQGMYSVATDVDKARSMTNPPLKDFISLYLVGDIMPNQGFEHTACLRYGTRHIAYDPQFPVLPPGR